MKSRGDRLEHRAVVDERGHQGALLHRPFRPTEVRRFGEGHSGRMPVAETPSQEGLEPTRDWGCGGVK